MTVELYADDAPGTVANFVKLSKEGFYDGLIFHRVIPDFVVQGGCPYGTDTGGSQFFICHNRTNTAHLDGVHTCFGKICDEAGLEVLDNIRRGDVIETITIVEE